MIIGLISLFLIKHGGIWCIVMFGLCGISGLIASFDPSSLKITVLILFDLIAVILCLPLIFVWFMEVVMSWLGRARGDSGNVLGATTLAIVGLEWVITMSSLVIACLSMCSCCRRNKEPSIIELTDVYQDNINNENKIKSSVGYHRLLSSHSNASNGK